MSESQSTSDTSTARRPANPRTYQARLRALSVRLADVREAERRKLSRDLHNQMGHELGLARLKLSSLLRGGDFELQQGLRARLVELENHLKRAIHQTRNLVHEYYPQVLDDAGLIPALGWLSTHYAERQGLHIEIEVDPACENLSTSPSIRGRLFTAVRECLFNAYKYADANLIRIRVARDDADRLHIAIEDDGRGFDVALLDDLDRRNGGYGLFSIGEMVEYLDGAFSCTSEENRGTRIDIHVPLNRLLEE